MSWLQSQLGLQETDNPVKELMQIAIEACVEARARHLGLPQATYMAWADRFDPERKQIEQRIWIGDLPIETRNPDTRVRIVHPVVDVNKRGWTT